MDARLLVEAPFMRSETFGLDLPKEPLVTIARVELAEGQGDKENERWGLLYFKEPNAKPLKVNRTHQKCLIAMFGQETNDWVGKRIQLYAMRGRWFGQDRTAVRIKGSPDLKQAVSVSVKEGRGKSATAKVYDLQPIGAKEAKPSTPQVDAKLHVIFKKSPMYGRALVDLGIESLQGLLALGTEAMNSGQLSTDQLAKLETQAAAVKALLETKQAAQQREPGDDI